MRLMGARGIGREEDEGVEARKGGVGGRYMGVELEVKWK